MRSFKKLSLIAAALMASTAMVQAADIIPEPTYDPVPREVMPTPVASGWYIRGDIGYAAMESKGVEYYQGGALTGQFETYDLDSTWALTGGLGYQVTDYLRIDGTLSYYGASDFTGSSAQQAACNEPAPGAFADICDYSDTAELKSAVVLLANAYVDFGTINGFTPYMGVGLGTAHVKYGALSNDQTCNGGGAACNAYDFTHVGEASWRFAYAAHVGASYDVSCRTKIDAGYTYTGIAGGKMFGGTTTGAGGNGYDKGLGIHSGHIGIRYATSDAGCHAPMVAYDEQPNIVYK